jgi:hypothetical protein
MNLSRIPVLLLSFGLCVTTSLAGQQRAWRDPSSHRVRFITVEQGIRLEVLDWVGTSPRPIGDSNLEIIAAAAHPPDLT